ncbi:Carboxypeptidase regulatory-like domain-containing protein [Marinitoga hydrogenitolerans DSM 16785]|uniref:Carboxypeptidase regulatory-like domain-containing protein n=1 Tax=Marinitoga hydrogenitolerans (strain DSM 16785 / JCM 12826 / AT1271) TaxID=1122195 RepID=A0A1M4XV17_MARH1|nr:carboxypeptidase-like regulatory domain-containing protein [Marinitoga hydrogenitolerans]SHE97270.1 Carboxypeptidase regulatory-like domain-containing protein [Marinitoga hydrogenitolerans DSM 16785]
MVKKIFFLCLIFILLFSLFSCDRLQPTEEGSLKFVVKDKNTNLPISGAQIKITQNGILKITALTDENGEYLFTSDAGEYNYEVSKIYYLPTNGNAKVYAKELRSVNIFLEPTENNPPNFIGYISPLNNQIVKEKTVDFQWNAQDIENDAIYYNIYLKYVGNEFQKLNTLPLTNTQYTYEPPFKGTYQWRIELWDKPNENYKIIVYEAPQFDYQPTSDSTINHKPEIYLISPVNIIIEKSNVTFTWEASDLDKDPLTFDLFLGKSQNSLANIVSDYNKTSYTYSLSSVGTYYWKILAYDGKETSESNVSSFEYLPPENNPPMISLISPTDYATFDTNDIQFSWIATDTDNSTLNYKLSIGKTNANMTEVLSLDEEDEKEISFTYRLPEPGDFYWNITVSDGINPYVNSEIRKFTIISNNNPPVIDDNHKPDVDTVVGTQVSFEWNAYDPEGTPLTFDFYLSDIYDEVNNLIENTYTSTNLNTKFLKDVILDYSSTYFWRIVAKDGMYEIPGPIWSFNFIKKEEGALADLYFNPETLNLSKNSTTSFIIKSSFIENIYGFDIRIGYDPLFITINPDECLENNVFNNGDFHIIKKVIEYDDHNEFIFSIISNSNNFKIPENIIEITLHSINDGNTKIKFEKSTYIFGPNEPEIIFSTGDSIKVTISE